MQTRPRFEWDALLRWAQARVDLVLADVSAEFRHIDVILTGLRGEGAQPSRHTELYFVATNASDVEFYISTSCNMRNDKTTVRIVLEKVDRDDALSGALVYIPVLPGRGKLMKYTPRQEKEITTLLSAAKTQLECTLANGKLVKTAEFDPTRFIATEETYATH